MSVTVLIPTTLRSYTGSRSELELQGATVAEVIQNLADEYPQAEHVLFEEEGKLRSFINVFVGNTNIKKLEGYDTPVSDRDVIMLIPAIAGGSISDSVLDSERSEKLDNNEIMRYSRHLLLKEVGVKGQKRLKAARVLVVGVGGLPLI